GLHPDHLLRSGTAAPLRAARSPWLRTAPGRSDTPPGFFSSTAVAGQAVLAGELCADPGQLSLHRPRFAHFDHGAPPGQVPGDVERGGRGDADPGTPVAQLAVGVAVPSEVITQDR